MFQNGGRRIRFRHVIEPPTKAAHTIIQTLIIGWITPSTCLVCLGIVFSEIGGYFIQDILTHLVPSCVNVRCWWDRNWTQIFPLSLFLPRGNIKNDFFFLFMVSRKHFPKALYGCKLKGATPWHCMRMNNGDLSAKRCSCGCQLWLSKPICE